MQVNSVSAQMRPAFKSGNITVYEPESAPLNDEDKAFFIDTATSLTKKAVDKTNEDSVSGKLVKLGAAATVGGLSIYAAPKIMSRFMTEGLGSKLLKTPGIEQVMDGTYTGMSKAYTGTRTLLAKMHGSKHPVIRKAANKLFKGFNFISKTLRQYVTDPTVTEQFTSKAAKQAEYAKRLFWKGATLGAGTYVGLGEGKKVWDSNNDNIPDILQNTAKKAVLA